MKALIKILPVCTTLDHLSLIEKNGFDTIRHNDSFFTLHLYYIPSLIYYTMELLKVFFELQHIYVVENPL